MITFLFIIYISEDNWHLHIRVTSKKIGPFRFHPLTKLS